MIQRVDEILIPHTISKMLAFGNTKCFCYYKWQIGTDLFKSVGLIIHYLKLTHFQVWGLTVIKHELSLCLCFIFILCTGFIMAIAGPTSQASSCYQKSVVLSLDLICVYRKYLIQNLLFLNLKSIYQYHDLFSIILLKTWKYISDKYRILNISWSRQHMMVRFLVVIQTL